MLEDGAWIHRIYIFLVPFGNTNPADMAAMCSKKNIFLIVALFLPFLERIMDSYVRKYADFILKNNIQKFFELDIDVVVGLRKVEYYRCYLEDKTGRKPIPVWHASRKRDYFLRMCEEYPYVAIGTTSAMEEGRRIRQNPMVLKWFIDQAHSAGIRIHGLGFTSSKYLPYLKFDSVDSTTWLSGARYGQIYKFDNGQMQYYDPPKGMRARHHDLVNRHNFNEWVKFQKYAEEFL